ncbi:MAG: hypothetical protein QME66_04680 [Candidatus Eisenbacteria bacterium]|nr:hypothetical protein [Candidatus Eisenbacteria bacterium]
MTDQIPIDELIMRAILAGFGGIRVENGYNSDLGEHVFEWREEAVPETLLPCINFQDTKQGTFIAAQEHEHTMTVEGELLLGSKETSLQKIEPPQMLRLMLADITKCLGANLTWGGLAEDTTVPSEDSIVMLHQGKKLVGAKFSFQVTYLTEPFNPYQ